MITRRKIMGYLAGMLGAGVTGAQAGVSPARAPDDIFDSFWACGPPKYVRTEVRRSAEYHQIIDDLVQLERDTTNYPCVVIHPTTMTLLWNDSIPRMLLELPKPTYEHRVVLGLTGVVLVVRPTPQNGYRPWDVCKRLR